MIQIAEHLAQTVPAMRACEALRVSRSALYRAGLAPRHRGWIPLAVGGR